MMNSATIKSRCNNLSDIADSASQSVSAPSQQNLPLANGRRRITHSPERNKQLNVTQNRPAPSIHASFRQSSTVGNSSVIWNFKVNCSVRGANCRNAIHSPAIEQLIALPLENFQTFPSP